MSRTAKHQLDKATVREYFEYDGMYLYWKKKCSRMSRAKIGSIAGNISQNGYVVVKFRNQEYKVHNLIWNWHYGKITDNVTIDHINRIRHDNRLTNLRLATWSDQIKNTNLRKNNTCGHKHINPCKAAKGKLMVRFTHNGKRIYLGLFDDIDSAITARDKAMMEVL